MSDRLSVEKRLTLVKFVIHEEPHITIDLEKCKGCIEKYCTKVCPAGLYTLDEKGNVSFNYEGCFECGACRIACTHGSVKWSYPLGGYGVYFQFG